jgi:cephalosporin hydroxylase
MKPKVETAQTPFELEQLLLIFNDLNPDRVLEIGTWHGGTLWHWLQGSRTVVAIDDTMYEASEWQQWAADAGSVLHLIQGYSHHPNVIARAEELGPYQFLFIDADHTYEAVRADWDNYEPMVEDGGIVVFHDFQPRQDYGVSVLWEQIKTETGARTVEISQRSDPPGFQGIAAVWM